MAITALTHRASLPCSRRTPGWVGPHERVHQTTPELGGETGMSEQAERCKTDALTLPDNVLAQNLAMLPPKRTYSFAAGLLSKLDVPMRPVLAGSLDVPADAKRDAVLELLKQARLGHVRTVAAGRRNRLRPSQRSGFSCRPVTGQRGRVHRHTARLH
jgi:hypothetical protein